MERATVSGAVGFNHRWIGVFVAFAGRFPYFSIGIAKVRFFFCNFALCKMEARYLLVCLLLIL